jgi:hypothetical protein
MLATLIYIIWLYSRKFENFKLLPITVNALC